MTTLLSLQHITTLILRENKITALPSEIGRLSQLTALDVSHNNLHSLPEGVCVCVCMCVCECVCVCVYVRACVCV